MQKDPIHCLHLIRSADFHCNLFGRHGPPPLAAQAGKHVVLQTQDGGCGPLARLYPWLMVGIDADQGGIKADRAFEEGNQCTDGTGIKPLERNGE